MKEEYGATGFRCEYCGEAFNSNDSYFLHWPNRPCTEELLEIANKRARLTLTLRLLNEADYKLRLAEAELAT